MNMEKPYQKSCLMMEFGILIQPYEELAQFEFSRIDLVFVQQSNEIAAIPALF